MYRGLSRVFFPLFLILITLTTPIFTWGSEAIVTGYDTQTEWFAGGAGLSSDRAVMTVNLLAGSSYGSLNGRGDLVRMNDTTGEYYKAGYGIWSLSLTGSYTGKLQGKGSGSVSGSITGNMDGDPLNIGVGGTWSLELDATLGGMILEIYPTYSNKPSEISYTSYLQRALIFQPLSEAGSISLDVYPARLSVSQPGTYRVLLSSELLDTTGTPIPDRNIRFEGTSALPIVQLPSGSTNQDGVASTSLLVTVPNLDSLPQDIGISATDTLSGIGISNLVTVEQTQVEIKINDVPPASLQDKKWLTDTNNIMVSGRVQGLDLESIEMVADIDSEEGSYLYDNRPGLDQDGYFYVPVSLYTAGSDYKLTVTASDGTGITVSDTVTISYLGPSLVKIMSISAPDRVDPTLYDSFDVDVEVRTVNVEPTDLYLDLVIGSYSDQKVMQVEAGDHTHQVSFNVPLSPLQTVSSGPKEKGSIHTLLYTGEAEPVEAQNTENQGNISGIIDVSTDNGSGDTDTFDAPEIGEADIGIAVNIFSQLPYPKDMGTGNDRFDCETKQWTRYSRHSNVLDSMKAKRKTFPQWIKALGVGIDVQWTKVGNIDFDVTSATVEVIRLPHNFPEVETIYATSEHITETEYTQHLSTRWGKGGDPPSGEYKIRVTYRVQYTMNGELREDEFQRTSERSFWVNPKRVDPCGEDFDHQTLYEEKSYEVQRGRTDLMMNNQGDRATGSFNPGAQTSGVLGGWSKPEMHTVSMTEAQSVEPITMYLDWSDDSADLDLTLIDPLGRSLGYIYSEGITVNGIPGVEYSGNDVKPEWVKFNDFIEGEYLVSVYSVKSDGPVEAWLQVGEEVSSGLVVNQHGIGTGIDENGYLTDTGFLFSPKDLVYSHVEFSGIVIGDIVRWVFTGPQGLEIEESVIMEYEGDAYAYAPIDLRNYPSEEVVGSWEVDVYVNDSQVSSATFEVNPLGGLIPGYTFTSIILGIACGLYLIKRGIFS